MTAAADTLSTGPDAAAPSRSCAADPNLECTISNDENLLENRLIVCLASDYDYDPTGKHHIMRELSRRNHILWVNYHGSRRPGLNTADITKAARTLLRAAGGLRSVSPALTHLTPLVLPGATGRLARSINRGLLRTQIQSRLTSLTRSAPLPVQVWSFAPDVAYLRGAFNEEAFIYYCVDEFSEFAGYDAAIVRRQEEELLRVADVVFASSEPLAAARRGLRPEIHLIRHGVEYDHFARAWRSPWPTPPDLKDLDGPLFGFFGLIGDWVDVGMIAEVARLRPRFHFILLGECRTDVASLRRLPNVRLMGRKPYADLPAYCSRFCAGLLPFRQNNLTRNVNPIKLREYLAAGLPVVSTPMPETQRYAPHVWTVEDAAGFAQACDALAVPRSRTDNERISRRVAGENWTCVVRELSRTVRQYLEARGTGTIKARSGRQNDPGR